MKNSCIIRLDPYEVKEFTLKIKDKWDCVRLLLHCARFISINYADRSIAVPPKASISTLGEYLKLDILPVPRIYLYVGSNKYISIVFPFMFDTRLGTPKLWYKGVWVTERIISGVLTLINSHKENNSIIGKTNSSLIELYLSDDEFDTLPDESYYLLGELLSLEMGYIRHDHDPANENGKIHPKIHFDINYSQNATFKYGISKMLSSQEFERIFDKNSDCYYLSL